MFDFIIKNVYASGLGTEFAPQADMMGGGGSMDLFWKVAGLLVLAGIAGFFAYKFFLE